MKKMLIVTAALVTLTAIFTGCAQPAVQPQSTPPQQNVAPAPVQNDEPKDGASQKVAAEATDAQGKLTGWIDGNSVEIQMSPSDAVAFRVTDVLTQMEGIKDGETVKFSYIQNDQGQMIITKIEKAQ